MVGASLQLARSVHPERMYVGALISKGQAGVPRTKLETPDGPNKKAGRG